MTTDLLMIIMMLLVMLINILAVTYMLHLTRTKQVELVEQETIDPDQEEDWRTEFDRRIRELSETVNQADELHPDVKNLEHNSVDHMITRPVKHEIAD